MREIDRPIGGEIYIHIFTEISREREREIERREKNGVR